jgi:hypothetical protein
MDSNSKGLSLIPDRVCGECTACCHFLSIDNPELVKLPNVTCKNLLESGGCGIHSSLPKVCKEWFCAWRYTTHLGDDWRPDKIGAILEFCYENYPGDFSGKLGLRFTIIDKKKIFLNTKFPNFIGNQISNGIPCILTYGGGPGESSATVFLNYALEQAIKERNLQALVDELVKAIITCEILPKERLKIEDGKLVVIPAKAN